MASPSPDSAGDIEERRNVSSVAETEAYDELSPLLSTPRAGTHMEQIPPGASIYNSILYIPPLARHKQGHYCSREVFLAFTLFFITMLLQGGLTFITGKDILTRYNLWVDTLVEDVSDVNYADWDAFGAVDTVHKTSNYAWDGAHWILRTDADKSKVNCCHGSQCAVLDLPCCPPIPRNTTKAHKASLLAMRSQSNPANVSMSAKPKRRETDGDGPAAKQRSPAICMRQADGKLNCAPPSVAFLDHWQDLDWDGDGVWTVEEAREDPANLACRIGVPTVDVFQNACRGLVQDSRDTADLLYRKSKMPTSVMRAEGIPFDYFKWWQGITALCVTTDAAFCGQLVARGLFDGALNPEHHGGRGAVTNLDSAMSYCSRLLTPGGVCDKALPGTYVLYRSRVSEKCGEGAYSQGHRYVNPYDAHDVMSTVDVSYSMHLEYQSTHSLSFQVFLCFILFLWYSNLVDELKDILQQLDFAMNFPVDRQIETLPPNISRSLASMRLTSVTGNAAQSTEERKEDVLEKTYDDGSSMKEIRRISILHWQMVSLIVAVRGIMLMYMTYAGTFFLLSNHTFIDLLLNSVALAFIFELDEFLYAFLVSEETKRELETCEPLKFRSSFPQHGNKAGLYKKGNWGLVIIPVLCVIIVIWNDRHNTLPILDALECACYAEGAGCHDNQLFSKEWWGQYWSATTKLAD